MAQEYRDMKTLNKELLEKDEEVDKKIAALPKYVPVGTAISVLMVSIGARSRDTSCDGYFFL